MFKLFERQPNWALKQLVQETDQPAVCLSNQADIDDRFFLFICFFYLRRMIVKLTVFIIVAKYCSRVFTCQILLLFSVECSNS
jgi:hypothetical protein